MWRSHDQAAPPPQCRRRAAGLLRPPFRQAPPQGAGHAVPRSPARARDHPGRGAAGSARPVPGGAAHRARDRLWRRRASEPAGPPAPRGRIHRLRGVLGRHRQAGAADRRAGAAERPAVHRRRAQAPGQAARRLGRRGLSALSRPLAQDAAPQAPVRLADHAGRTGPGAEAGRCVPFRHRYRGLRQLDAGPHPAFAGLRLRARRPRRLASALCGLGADPLRGKGAARRPRHQFLFHLHAALTRRVDISSAAAPPACCRRSPRSWPSPPG